MSENIMNEFMDAATRNDYETMASIIRTTRSQLRSDPESFQQLPVASLIEILSTCPSDLVQGEIVSLLGLVVDSTDTASLTSTFGESLLAAGGSSSIIVQELGVKYFIKCLKDDQVLTEDAVKRFSAIMFGGSIKLYEIVSVALKQYNALSKYPFLKAYLKSYVDEFQDSLGVNDSRLLEVLITEKEGKDIALKHINGEDELMSQFALDLLRSSIEKELVDGLDYLGDIMPLLRDQSRSSSFIRSIYVMRAIFEKRNPVIIPVFFQHEAQLADAIVKCLDSGNLAEYGAAHTFISSLCYNEIMPDNTLASSAYKPIFWEPIFHGDARKCEIALNNLILVIDSSHRWTQELKTSRLGRIYAALQDCTQAHPIDSLIDRCKNQLDEDLHGRFYLLLRTFVNCSVFLQDVVDNTRLVSFLLDRDSDTRGLKSKYNIIRELAVKDGISPGLKERLDQYIRDGPVYVSRVYQLATENRQ